jgi:hypothetical protein
MDGIWTVIPTIFNSNNDIDHEDEDEQTEDEHDTAEGDEEEGGVSDTDEIITNKKNEND